MKKRIDLFSQRITSKQLVDYLRHVRVYSLTLFIVQLVIIILLSVLFLYFSSLTDRLSEKKSTYNRYIVLNTPFVQDLRRFAVKFSLLKETLKDDARSYTYYNHLKTIISKAPAKGEILDFSIDNTQKIEFTIQVSTYEDAIAFIEYSENPSFLENFTVITLNEFQIDAGENSSYDLAYSGSFVPLP